MPIQPFHPTGPELLVDHEEYDYSLDLWSFGCILASLVRAFAILPQPPPSFPSHLLNL